MRIHVSHVQLTCMVTNMWTINVWWWGHSRAANVHGTNVWTITNVCVTINVWWWGHSRAANVHGTNMWTITNVCETINMWWWGAFTCS